MKIRLAFLLCLTLVCWFSLICEAANNEHYASLNCDEPCPDLDYRICGRGYMPIRQVKTDDECCDKIVCVQESNHNNFNDESYDDGGSVHNNDPTHHTQIEEINIKKEKDVYIDFDLNLNSKLKTKQIKYL
jgi:hypothetical protein